MKQINSASHVQQPHFGYGVGLRPRHFSYVLDNDVKVDWFEIITETFLSHRGRPHSVIEALKERFTIIPHGVSLSIGSQAPLNLAYLSELKAFAATLKAPYVTDHLCWTGAAGINLHELLPLPLTEESLHHVSSRLNVVMDHIGIPIALENPSAYLQFSQSSIPEWEFLSALHMQTGCGILLDLNNLFISTRNFGFDPYQYIKSLPPQAVVQYHLAGHSNKGDYLLDTHIGPIPADVIKLYQFAVRTIGPRSTLIEWDQDIPEFSILEGECERARTSVTTAQRKPTRDERLAL